MVIKMGKIISKITRPIKMINIDNRVQAVISKSKPSPAPMYETTEKQLEVVKKLYPTFMENQKEKDLQLDSHLKNVYVTSKESQSVIESSSTHKQLPKLRTTSDEFEYGFWQPEHVSSDKITLKMAVEILATNALQSKYYNAKRLSEKYNLNPKLVEKIITHYNLFIKREPRQKIEETKNVVDYVENVVKRIFIQHKPKNND